jgi:YHS domain-containing protein
MNRCITCGKMVTEPKAQNVIVRDHHKYLVCCPLCEKEFNRDPEHYMAVAYTLFGKFGVEVYSQTERETAPNEAVEHPRAPGFDIEHMLRGLQESSDELQRQYRELLRHFENITEVGGLEGLRNALLKHQKLMDELRKKIGVHCGVCRFVMRVAESHAKEPY